MNKNAKIKVKTPFGETETRDVGPVVTQGSVDAFLISSNSIDGGVSDAFDDESKEVKYEELKLAPMLYMDDITRAAENTETAQYANNKMEELLGPKSLKQNL